MARTPGSKNKKTIANTTINKRGRTHTLGFKTQVVEAWRDSDKTVAAICKEFKIVPSQLYKWEKELKELSEEALILAYEGTGEVSSHLQDKKLAAEYLDVWARKAAERDSFPLPDSDPTPDTDYTKDIDHHVSRARFTTDSQPAAPDPSTAACEAKVAPHEGRNSKGQFLPGFNGNRPTISPKALRAHRELIASNIPAYIGELHKLAMMEDKGIAYLQLKLQALKTLLDLVMPAAPEPREIPSDQGIDLSNIDSLPQIAQASISIIKQLGEGAISSEEAKGLLENLLTHNKVIEIVKVDPIIEEYERRKRSERRH